MAIKAAYLFVTNTEGGTISVIDTDKRKIIGTIPLGEKSYPYHIVVLRNK